MEEIVNNFRNVNSSNTTIFTLNKYTTYARICDVHDGDTITAIIPLFNKYYKFHIRLNNIDTCELRSKLPDNKNKAILARNRLINLITNKEQLLLENTKAIKKVFDDDIYLVWLHCYDFDKYGRLLADIYKNENDIFCFSQILIDEKLGYQYGGKKKLTEQEQIDLLK